MERPNTDLREFRGKTIKSTGPNLNFVPSGLGFPAYLPQTIAETLLSDENRLYFTGGSDGEGMSFNNAARTKSAAAMPHIGDIPEETEIKKADLSDISFIPSFPSEFSETGSVHAEAA